MGLDLRRQPHHRRRLAEGRNFVPYKSEKQRKFMHAKHPKIAARWDKETGGKVVKKKRKK